MLEHKPQSIFESARSVLEASFASSEEEYLKTKRIPRPAWIPKDFKKGELKPVKSARSYLGKTTEFWVIERKEVELGRQDKFAMIAVTNPKNSISKVLAYYGSHPTADGAMKMAKNRNLIESVELEEASKAPDVKDYYDDQEDISKQWPISARKQLKFEKQKKGSVELIIVKAPSGQELERYQLVPGTGWTKLGESTNLKEAYQPSRYYRAVEENLERLLVLFNPNGQLAKELEREADNVSSEFNKLKGLIEEAIDIWESEIEYTVAMSNGAEDETIDDMDPSDFDESTFEDEE